jgi:5S rRNA maturation endonuclease (ribonuclease M5)
VDDALELVLGKLDDVRQHGGYWMARCPAHDDNKASLSVARGTEQPVVFKCHAGCDRDVILDALGLSLTDVSNPRDQNGQGEWTPAGEAIAVYDYTDEHGELLYQVCRTAGKQFPQRTKGPDGKWKWKLAGVRRVPYRLPRLIAAVRDSRTVYIVEGEKDVQAVERAGGVATCNPGGTGSTGLWAKPVFTAPFAGADVVVVADRDEPGRKHAAEVAAQLRTIAKSVTVAEPSEGKDAADHLAAGHSLDDLTAVPDSEAPGYAAIAAKYAAVNWHEAWNLQQQETDWLFEPILEVGTVNALFAKPGTGKSLLTLEIALRLVREGHVIVYVDDENRVTDLVDRLNAMGAVPDELHNLRMYSFAGLPPLDTAAGGVHLEALAVTDEASLVVLDTTSRMVQGKENDSDTFLQLYRCSLVPLKARGITVLRLDHPGKDETRGQRGSSAKDGDVDTVWRLTAETEGLDFRLERSKSRSGHGEGSVTLRRRYAPVRHDWSVGGTPDLSELSVRVLNALKDRNVPVLAGRDRCKKALADTGIKISNAQLSALIRLRKTCPGQFADSGDSSDPAAVPTTPTEGGDSGTGPVPDCAICGNPLDPKLAAAGFAVHPGCEDERRYR